MTVKELFEDTKQNPVNFCSAIFEFKYDINKNELLDLVGEMAYVISKHANISKELVEDIKEFTSLFEEE